MKNESIVCSVENDIFRTDVNTDMKNHFTRKQLLKLFAMIVLSDGYIHGTQKGPSSVRLWTAISSKNQHKLFRDMSIKLFNKKPQIYYQKTIQNPYSKTSAMVSELFSVDVIRELKSLSPTFKTTPSILTKDQYLSSLQPTIAFLFDEADDVKWTAIRIWFDFDGSISPSFKLKRKIEKKNGKCYKYFQVQFECEILLAETNPNLIKEFLYILNSLGIRAREKKDKRNWSGSGGIAISSLGSVKKFIKYGKPITNVEVSDKSNRFKGVPKSVVMSSVRSVIEEFPLSKHFKNKREAVKYKRLLNHRLYRAIRIRHSPVV